MIDGQALDDLPVVRRIRETIKKWWRLELGVTDSRGYVLDHARGVVTPPQNDFCRAALDDAETFKLCNKSVEQACASVQQSDEPGSRLVMPCHMGFPLAMCPVTLEGRFYGTVFTGGFLVEGHDEDARVQISRSARALGLRIRDHRAAGQEIPTLTERDLEYLGDLMEIVAAELGGRVTQHQDPRAIGDLIGRSPRMRRLYSLLDKVASSHTTILVLGENGTGKEVVAKAIHSTSPRAERPFVAVNCSALNENLLESQLFGHTKGSFTGAIRDKKGLFEIADGGTLFLDEVGDTSPGMQVKLLRALQERTIVPIGAEAPIKVDVRVVAATNRPLKQMIENGTFREDLYYRLNVIELEIPPLRERKMDLPLLYGHFLEERKGKSGERKTLSPDVVKAFWEYDWPGNVRQLGNEIERLVVLSGDSPVISPEHLSNPIRKLVDSTSQAADIAAVGGTLAEAVRSVERQVIRQALVKTGWNKSKCARELGMSRTTLIKKIKELGLEQGTRASG